MLSVYNNLSIRSLIDPPGSPYPQHYAMDGQPFGEEVQTNSHELLVIGSHLKYGNQGSWEAVGVFSPLPRHCPQVVIPLTIRWGAKASQGGSQSTKA